MRRFNVTGLCVPRKHYMVDISNKLVKIKELIDMECYFTINRARQYGKTTTLAVLGRVLQDEYIVISISFESFGIRSFESPETFCQTFIRHIVKALRFTSATEDYIDEWVNDNVTDFDLLSDHITAMCEDKKIVLPFNLPTLIDLSHFLTSKKVPHSSSWPVNLFMKQA